MHYALLIPDVRAYIFAYIKEDKQMGRCTFAMLARTCSALSEASLDVLWSELDSLRPLASCIYAANTMPLSDEAPDDDTRPDFSVFDKYAHRVRKLDLSGQQRFLRRNGGYPSLTEDLGALLYYPLNSPLLPNLRHLAWAPGMGLNLLRHLLGPHLLSLKIPSHRWSSASTLFALTKIPGLCPKIKSLTLQVHSWDGHIDSELTQSTHCISRVIGSWAKLEELDCNPMTSEGLLHLSGMESLRILRLQVNTASVIDLPPDSLSFPSMHTFHALSDVSLDALWSELPTANSILEAIRSLPKSIDIFLPVYQSGDVGVATVEPILQPIGRNVSCGNLEEFRMNVPACLSGSVVSGANVLRPLFLCCNLRVLRIMMTPLFLLVDDDLRAMASAWPLLEELELFDCRNLNRTAEITFHGLISLLELCPKLRFFNLAIDATKLDGLRGDKPGGGVCNRLVKYPRLIDSQISDPEAVARILLDILPELETIWGEGSPGPFTAMFNPTLPQGWDQVYERISVSKAAGGL
ncbi:hypothetical protein EV702DRAFT_964643 [Suillus placidus]|uniref:Uncharacterized protein n=1 Tax=Suillus placidus TaxID=48579 RepID=A0A9P7A125_9AGAM|nr:hypothetical protein EV702DRAFT_964643 [Suillus placidus]